MFQNLNAQLCKHNWKLLLESVKNYFSIILRFHFQKNQKKKETKVKQANNELPKLSQVARCWQPNKFWLNTIICLQRLWVEIFRYFVANTHFLRLSHAANQLTYWLIYELAALFYFLTDYYYYWSFRLWTQWKLLIKNISVSYCFLALIC